MRALGIIGFGLMLIVGLVYVIGKALPPPDNHPDSVEAALWAVVNYYGAWWWWGQAGISALIFFRMFYMRAPVTWTGVFARLCLWVGTFMMMTSPFNTGLGPFAYYVLLAAVFLMINQLCNENAPGILPRPGSAAASHAVQIAATKEVIKEVAVGRPLWERAVLHAIGPQGAINIAASVQHEQAMADALSGEERVK